MNLTPYDYFLAAFKSVIGSTPRGTQAKVALATGKSRVHINDVLHGRKSASQDLQASIATALGITYEEMLATGRIIIEGGTPNIQHLQPARSLVPLISWVQAGDWAEVVDSYQPGEAEAWIDTLKKYGKNTFALRVNGDSMSPRFPDGCIITVDPDCREENGSFVVAKINHDEATFKQLVSDGGRIYLKPLNERYPIMDVTGRDLHICGVVREKLVREEI